jgi:hypothetical protein
MDNLRSIGKSLAHSFHNFNAHPSGTVVSDMMTMMGRTGIKPACIHLASLMHHVWQAYCFESTWAGRPPNFWQNQINN